MKQETQLGRDILKTIGSMLFLFSVIMIINLNKYGFDRRNGVVYKQTIDLNSDHQYVIVDFKESEYSGRYVLNDTIRLPYCLTHKGLPELIDVDSIMAGDIWSFRAKSRSVLIKRNERIIYKCNNADYKI